MKKIYFIIILVCFTLVACVTKYNFRFDNVDQVELGKITRSLEKANYLKENEMWLIFFTGFNNTQIIITENSKVKSDTIITSKENYPFTANVFKINKNAIVEITSKSFSKSLIIQPENMLGYKSVYISKSGNKIEIHFTERNKPVEEQRRKDSLITRKYKRNKLKNQNNEIAKDTINDSLK